MTEVASGVDTAIFDFDGTVADSSDVNLAATAQVLRRPPFTTEEIVDMRTLPTRESMRNLGVRTWQLPYLLMRGRRIAAQKMDEVEAFEGVPEAMRELSEEEYKLFVLSTNSLENITGLLARSGLERAVSGIYAGAGMFNKARRLSGLMRREGLSAEQCVYAGDETRDIDAARQAGMRSVAVAWGYHDPELLAAHDPDIIVATPADLVAAVQSL